MIHRHLDYAEDAAPSELGLAALDDLLDRGDLESWRPIAAAIREDPWGQLADKVLHLCSAHPMYGTGPLWRAWIEKRRGPRAQRPLAELRRRAGLTQQQVAARLGIAQPDVSKLEARTDVRLSTLRSYVEGVGATLRVSATLPDGTAIEVV